MQTQTKTRAHQMTGFDQCTFGDGGYYYHDGYDRATCSCGWRSAPSRDHKALVMLWDIHKRDAAAADPASGETPR